MPTSVHVEALTTTVKKGRPIEGWRHSTVVAPMTALEGEPTATATHVVCSREAAVVRAAAKATLNGFDGGRPVVAMLTPPDGGGGGSIGSMQANLGRIRSDGPDLGRARLLGRLLGTEARIGPNMVDGYVVGRICAEWAELGPRRLEPSARG
jgi:hypothetical protein